MTTAPDTLSTARRLQTEFGMEQLASEGVAIAIHDHVTQNLATKEDIKLLKGEIEVVKADLKGEIEVVKADLKGEIEVVKADLKGEIEAVRADLKGEIEVVKADLERQIAEVRIDMSNEFKSLYRNLWAMAGVIVAATVALGKLLP